jgi:hypothetical protein
LNDEYEPPVRQTEATPRVGLARTSSPDILQAQANTADLLESLGLTEAQVLPALEREAAREAFGHLATAPEDPYTKEALLAFKAPEQVRMVTAMLTAYDWEFVEQAKQLRSYVVNRLVVESREADKAGDRIKALTALGKVTEVGLFTEKVEVKGQVQTDEELDSRIKERLAKLRGVLDALPHNREVEDADAKPGQEG